jgi:hypothetical protein
LVVEGTEVVVEEIVPEVMVVDDTVRLLPEELQELLVLPLLAMKPCPAGRLYCTSAGYTHVK